MSADEKGIGFLQGVAGTGIGVATLYSTMSRMGVGALGSMGFDPYSAHDFSSYNLSAGGRGPIIGSWGTAAMSSDLNIGARAYAGQYQLVDPKDVAKGFTQLERKAAGTTMEKVLGLGMGVAMPILFTGYFGYERYKEEGGRGFLNYMIEDTAANYYGIQASRREIAFANTEANRIKFLGTPEAPPGLDRTSMNNFSGPAELKRTTSLRMFGTNFFIGRMLPTLGGYFGAGIGLQAGTAIGDSLGKLVGLEGQAPGLAGGIFGALGGASLGAAMATGGHRMALSALAIGGGMMVADTVSDFLSTGFKNPKARGLDLAGDTAAYFNSQASTMRQRAVQAMHKSHLNARSALGNEASLMHTNRDFFSNYRRL
jgi:hypothetical protein